MKAHSAFSAWMQCLEANTLSKLLGYYWILSIVTICLKTDIQIYQALNVPCHPERRFFHPRRPSPENR